MTTPAGAASERERRIATYRAVFEEVINRGNFDVIPELFHPHFLLHSPVDDEPLRGHPGYRAFAERVRGGFPDVAITIHDVVLDGDVAVGRMTIEGTQTKPYMGIPPTGRRVKISQIVWGRFEGDRIAEAWQELNAIGLLLTLGAAPGGGVGPLGLIGWALATVGRFGFLQARYARRRRGEAAA
jgi:predicted ester cyclase